MRLLDRQRAATTQGMPQAGPLWPLLTSVMLYPLDQKPEGQGFGFARNADDFLILVAGIRAAQREMQRSIRFEEDRLGTESRKPRGM